MPKRVIKTNLDGSGHFDRIHITYSILLRAEMCYINVYKTSGDHILAGWMVTWTMVNN